MTTSLDFSFVCPSCHTPLDSHDPEKMICPRDSCSYPKESGIWRFLTPERRRYFEKFVREYESVRRAEGRGSSDSAYYQALPFKDLSGRMSADWKIRACSYQTMVQRILQPLEAQRGRPLKVLDLGAGNGWLSYRLAQRGHLAAAVDLVDNVFDGLGAHIHFPAHFTPVQAEFDRIPFTGKQFDLAIFNASLHYSTNYETTLREAQRVLQPGGYLVILDSPIYHDSRSGTQMVREREAHFEQEYGFPSNAIASENFLTYHKLDELSGALRLHWQLITPFYGLHWALRPWLARLHGRREPARFVLILGSSPPQ